eukprot:c27661_g3_i1 orf=162-356(-)
MHMILVKVVSFIGIWDTLPVTSEVPSKSLCFQLSLYVLHEALNLAAILTAFLFECFLYMLCYNL